MTEQARSFVREPHDLIKKERGARRRFAPHIWRRGASANTEAVLIGGEP